MAKITSKQPLVRLPVASKKFTSVRLKFPVDLWNDLRLYAEMLLESQEGTSYTKKDLESIVTNCVLPQLLDIAVTYGVKVENPNEFSEIVKVTLPSDNYEKIQGITESVFGEGSMAAKGVKKDLLETVVVPQLVKKALLMDGGFRAYKKTSRGSNDLTAEHANVDFGDVTVTDTTSISEKEV